MNVIETGNFRYSDTRLGLHHSFLLPEVLAELTYLKDRTNFVNDKRIFDLGCGNGSVAILLSQHGFEVTGIDLSSEGISISKTCDRSVNLHIGSVYDPLSSEYGTFPVVLCLEVIEHVFAPRIVAQTALDLLEPGGTLIMSTPYHGYFKNLALAITNKFDDHFTALWDGGHIKFWSMNTLSTLLSECGFVDIRFKRVGRVGIFAKSMIAIAKKR